MDNCPLSGVFLVCAERKLLRAASPFDPAFAKASAFVKTTAGKQAQGLQQATDCGFRHFV